MICSWCNRQAITRPYKEEKQGFEYTIRICDECYNILNSDDIITIDIVLDGDETFDCSWLEIRKKSILDDSDNIVQLSVFKNSVRQMGFDVDVNNLASVLQIFCVRGD